MNEKSIIKRLRKLVNRKSQRRGKGSVLKKSKKESTLSMAMMLQMAVALVIPQIPKLQLYPLFQLVTACLMKKQTCWIRH